MNTTISNDTRTGVDTVRMHVGVWFRDDHTFVRFSGPDVASWLQTQTTNDVLALQSGQGHANALLDRKGRLQAHFTLHRWEDEYWLIVEKSQVVRLLQQFEDHLFLERVKWTDAGEEIEELLVQGPRALMLMGTVLGDAAVTELPRDPYSCAPLELAGFQVLCFQLSVTGEDGYLLVAQAGERQALSEALLAAGQPYGARTVDASAREVLRVEAGIPRFDIDMDTNFRIPETTLEREAVSYSKGCYLGQEVVARLKAYAAPKQALMGLIFGADAQVPEFDSPIFAEGKQIGVVKSAVFSPTLSRPIALAYLDRDHRAPGLELSNGGEVTVLPFHRSPSRHERARLLYEEALELFERDLRDEDDRDIHLLKEAVLLDPAFEDAFEALGVILNRHGRVDEAIHYMKLLESLNPNSVMAHTNLSVFYVAKGMIEEAETEKAKSAVLQIRNSSQARKAEEMAAAERERIRREAAGRIEMFKEVIEIDPDDPLATFGMGVAHIQLDEYDKAIPFLEHATRVSKDYSAAYLQLGKCFEFTEQVERAREAFRKGIEVATRKGDLMPLREMERRLNNLPTQSL